MQRLLDQAAGAVRSRPAVVLIGLAVLTVVMIGLATRLEAQADIAEFAPDDIPTARAMNTVREMGATGRSVVVIVDAGEGGDVTEPEGIRLAERIVEAVEADDDIRPHLARDSFAFPRIASYATPPLVLLDAIDARAGDLDDDMLTEAVARSYEEGLVEELRALFSEEVDPIDVSSRAGLVNVNLSAELDRSEAREIGLAVRDAVRAVDVDSHQVVVYSPEILSADLDDQLLEELPLLVGLSLLVIVVVLGAAFRRVGDVLLTLVALAGTLTWMAGSMALLGPRFLGITGEFSQIAIAVPVMLVGLGVDYAIHLTGRYREELRQGRHPADAASLPLRTVGRALILVTVTTMVGFLANVISPLPPIADFAVFMAVGIGCACVVVGLFVPAARSLIDRRMTVERSDGDVPIAGSVGRLPRLMAAAAGLAARRPAPVLAVVAALTLIGAFAGSRLDTTFSQDEFIPGDTEIAAVVDRMEELFGGEVQERTFLLVEADLDDPTVANAMLDTGRRLEAVEEVVVTGEGAAVRSPAHLVPTVTATAEFNAIDERDGAEADLAEEFERAGWTGERFRQDADMERIWSLVESAAPGQMDNLAADGRNAAVVSVQTRAGDRVDSLVDEMDEAAAPLRSVGGVTVTGMQVVIADTLDALVDAQLQKILFSALAALIVLVVYFWAAHRRPGLGALTMIPTLVAVPMVLGGMWAAGLAFNALTATVAAVAIGFGVDYGIHVSNRFIEERERQSDSAEALTATVTHTGTALVASAVTTAGAFTVLLVFSDLLPLRQFGAVTAMTMVLALLATLFAQTSTLALWDRWHRMRESPR
jgi:uncharacterized protein